MQWENAVLRRFSVIAEMRKAFFAVRFDNTSMW